MKSDMWTTKDGRQIPVVDMDDRHVLSTIRLLKEAKCYFRFGYSRRRHV